MTDLTKFTLANGGTVVVQTPASGRVVDTGSLQKKASEAKASVKDALRDVTNTASEVLDGFRSMYRKPDEVEIELGVSFDASFGMVIAEASSGAHLTVKLRWTNDADEEQPKLPAPGADD